MPNNFNPYASFISRQMEGLGTSFSKGSSEFNKAGSSMSNPYSSAFSFGDPQGLGYSLKPQETTQNQFGINEGGLSNGANMVGGVASAGANIIGMSNNIKEGINMFRDANGSASATTFDQYGKPTYTLSDEIANREGLANAEAGKGMIGSSAMSGASAGAAIGGAVGSIVPGVGTAVVGLIGAGVGAVGGAVAGIFGKEKAKDEQAKKVSEMNANIKREQDVFNQANVGYGDYKEQSDLNALRRRDRMMSLYNIPQY